MTEAGAVPQNPGVFARLIGVLVSPRQTFQLIVARPRWLAAVAIVAVVAAICTGGFLMTEVGQRAWLDQADTSLDILGRLSDEQRAQQLAGMAKFAPFVGYLVGVQMLVIFPVVTLIFAGLLYLVFNVVMGGEATYKQVLAVVAHCGVVSIVQQVFVTPLNYLQESMSSPTNLSVFFKMLPEGTFLMRLLGIIDLFVIWNLIVLSIGLSVLYRRKTSSIATGLLTAYGIIAVVIAGVLTWMRG